MDKTLGYGPSVASSNLARDARMQVSYKWPVPLPSKQKMRVQVPLLAPGSWESKFKVAYDTKIWRNRYA